MLLKTYDLYDRMPERRRSLIEWDKEVRRILENRSTIAAVMTA